MTLPAVPLHSLVSLGDALAYPEVRAYLKALTYSAWYTTFSYVTTPHSLSIRRLSDSSVQLDFDAEWRVDGMNTDLAFRVVFRSVGDVVQCNVTFDANPWYCAKLMQFITMATQEMRLAVV